MKRETEKESFQGKCHGLAQAFLIFVRKLKEKNMKLIHLSDLHIGKKVNEVSMLEEQKHILSQIRGIVREEQPDAVLIAGDIYDKPNPSAEALTLFSDFLSELVRTVRPVFVISGNHDSAERISYMNAVLDGAGIYMSPVYDGQILPVTLEDCFGPVNFWLLPFVKPAVVRHFLEEDEKEEITSYDEAVRKAIDRMRICLEERNVLVAHQFITAARRSESEEVFVGGLDNVDVSVFESFDYVALGHLHRPQSCGRPEVRYCGSPLKYSFSEVNDVKSVTLVELGSKGEVGIREIPLHPLHDWFDLRGSYEELTAHDFYAGTRYQDDFVRLTLTDEEDVPDALNKLRTIYSSIMELRYDNTRTRSGLTVVGGTADVEKKTPQELFAELYLLQNGTELSEEQTAFLEETIEKAMENNR